MVFRNRSLDLLTWMIYFTQGQNGVSGLASGWSAVGCYDDDSWDRTLNKAYGWSLIMDYDSCTNFCDSLGYAYAGYVIVLLFNVLC